MAKQSLAVKYRPKKFGDVTEQGYVKEILLNQIKNNDIKNAYLFCGGAGTGKTTTARIFASEINEHQGNPIEVDAASNNGVENVRTIINDAKFKPLDSKYKVYIIDECHMLSTGAWNAMLKLLEEPPKTTIFILCTTDPQKIPATILSRVQRYDFQKISFNGIVSRLQYIIQEEGKIEYEQEALEYISKIAEGGMRDAISMLDKCLSFNKELTVDNVVKALGVSDYTNLDKLLNLILQADNKGCIDTIEKVYRSGKDLKQYIKQFINFVLDITKYQLYKDYDYIQIPNTINLDKYNNVFYDVLLNILDNFINLSAKIKYDTNPKTLIESNIIIFIKENGGNNYENK